MSILVGISCVFLACSDTARHSLQPEPRADLAPVAGPALTGCSRFEVQLRGRDSISATRMDRPECGAFHPVLAGAPEFDRTRGRVRLPIALENSGSASVRAPARLYGWEDSLAVLAPPGLAQNRHTRSYLSFLGYDSTLADTASAYSAARVWDFDALLGPSDSAAPILAAGGQSRPRWIELAVQQGVSAFELTVHAEARRARAPVPPVPPDGVPDSLYAASNVESHSPLMAGTFLRNIVLVTFVPGVTQAQRDAALDLIDAELVGGDPLTGIYFLRIQDDGTAGPLLKAMQLLDSLPQVGAAFPEFVGVIRSQYLKPYDGPSWRTWTLDPDSATGENWSLERVAAPYAWGCSPGDTATPIAVVDWGFHALREVRATNHPRYDVVPQVLHGTMVASVLAARGNDSIGITGMMWNSDLRLYEAAVHPDSSASLPRVDAAGRPVLVASRVLANLTRAGLAGARVINLSLGIDWEAIGGVGYVPHTAADSNVAARLRIGFVEALRRLEAAGSRPVVVVAAGNGGFDAFFDGFPGARDAFPGRVIVVGSSTLAGGLAAASNRGSLLDVAAPGEDVYALRGDDAPVEVSGTSVATPLVAGLAGLLISFDSRLTSDSVKTLIVAGAGRGGRTASGVPLVNAYESLRAAAERSGAPLCGNRVWSANGQLVAQRNRAQNTTEALFADGDTAGYLDVWHGGRRIEFWGRRTGSRAIVYRQGIWREVPLDSGEARTVHGGAYLSFLGLSHNVDSMVTVRRTQTAFAVVITELATWHQETIASVPDPWSVGAETTCIMYDPWTVPPCTAVGIGTSVTSGATVAYSPRGDQVFVVVTRLTNTASVASTYDCPWYIGGPPAPQCEQIAGSSSSGGATIYAINIHGDRTPRVIRELTGQQAMWVAGSEDGAEILTGRGSYASSSVTQMTSGLWGIRMVTTVLSQGWSNCGITLTSLPTGAAASPPVATGDVCVCGSGEGSVAPVIAAR